MSDDPRLGPGEGAALPPQDDGDTVAPPAQARGFLITIRGTTPNAGGARFIDSTLVKRLKSIDAATAYKAQVAFYVHDAEIAAANARVPQAAPGTGGFDAEDADARRVLSLPYSTWALAAEAWASEPAECGALARRGVAEVAAGEPAKMEEPDSAAASSPKRVPTPTTIRLFPARRSPVTPSSRCWWRLCWIPPRQRRPATTAWRRHQREGEIDRQVHP